MSACLKILSPGMLASIQDKGRFGFAGFGVPRSGAIDPVSLRLGNSLVGNEPYEAAIEFRFMGPTFTAQQGPIRLGLACYAGAELTKHQSNEKHQISPWQTVTLNEGDILKVLPFNDEATGYITIEGGLEIEPVLESCSTYARANIGGATGAHLQVNDLLRVKQSAKLRDYEKIMIHPVRFTDETLHVILGPQDDYFSDNELNGFLTNPFKVSTDVDRMGIRLEGIEVKTRADKGNDLISDGLVAGAIQIPGNGQPIILCVDCQSVGGYPKIATIISADLYRLGQIKPGAEIHFKAVDLTTAQTLFGEMEKAIDASISSIQDFYGEGSIDLAALYQTDIIGGVVEAQRPDHFPGHLEDKL